MWKLPIKQEYQYSQSKKNKIYYNFPNEIMQLFFFCKRVLPVGMEQNKKAQLSRKKAELFVNPWAGVKSDFF